jgi:hypothetical protein
MESVQEKLTYLPPNLLGELEDYLDFLLYKHHLLPKITQTAPIDLFGLCQGEIKTTGDIISPLEIELGYDHCNNRNCRNQTASSH